MSERSDKPTKCSCEGGSLVLCWALSEMVDGTRLKRPSVLDMKTMVVRHPWVVLHAGDHRKRGIAMNFCPFCGESLQGVRNDEDRSSL